VEVIVGEHSACTLAGEMVHLRIVVPSATGASTTTLK
jgi:hypothetical protein